MTLETFLDLATPNTSVTPTIRPENYRVLFEQTDGTLVGVENAFWNHGDKEMIVVAKELDSADPSDLKADEETDTEIAHRCKQRVNDY